MASKSEIGWKGRTETGEKREVYVQHVGSEWKFFVRVQRFEQWESMPTPPLEDWLELLDAVRRRVNRRLLRPEEEGRVKKAILEKFPGTDLN